LVENSEKQELTDEPKSMTEDHLWAIVRVLYTLSSDQNSTFDGVFEYARTPFNVRAKIEIDLMY
jgi:hypothetical protein